MLTISSLSLQSKPFGSWICGSMAQIMRPKGQPDKNSKFEKLEEAISVKQNNKKLRLFGIYHPIQTVDPKDECVTCGGFKPPYRLLHQKEYLPCSLPHKEEEEDDSKNRRNIRTNILLPSSANFWTDRQLRDRGKSLVSTGDDGLAIVPEDLSVVQKRGRRDKGDRGAQQRRRRQADAANRKIAGVSKKEWRLLKSDLMKHMKEDS